MSHVILSFYKYEFLSSLKELRNILLQFGQDNNLRGRILIADEGINGTLSGDIESVLIFQALLEDLHIHNIEYKAHLSEKHVFPKWSVKLRDEIVSLQHYVDVTKAGKHIDSFTFQQMKEKCSVLDVRSNCEHRLGKFKGAITLDIDLFKELPYVIGDLGLMKEKPLITYCTGGIKCEKASALLLQMGFKDVYQLDGGIIKYSEETDGKDFDGECYVFDSRLKISVNTMNPRVIGKCFRCRKKSSRVTDCVICNNHTIICDSCYKKYDDICSTMCTKYSKFYPSGNYPHAKKV